MVQNVESGPTDRERRVVAAIYFWFGVVTLLPWNAIINAKEYWMYKLRNLDEDEFSPTLENNGTIMAEASFFEARSMEYIQLQRPLNDMQLNWNSNLSMAAMFPNLLALGLNTLFGQRFSIRSRVIVSLAPVIAFLAGIYILVFVNTDSIQYLFYIFSLCTVGIITAMIGIYQGAIADMAGRFPPMFMGSVLQGEALGGVMASTLTVLMILLGSDGISVPKYTFPIVAVCLASAIPIYIRVITFRSFTYYANGMGTVSTLLDHPELDAGSRTDLDRVSTDSRPGTGMSGRSQQDYRMSSAMMPESSFAGPIGMPRIEMSPLPQLVGVMPVLRVIWLWALSIFINFAVTLSFFPSVAALAQSSITTQDEKWETKYFTPVACFLNFNVSDMLGRILSSFALKNPMMEPTTRGSLLTLALSLSRTIIAFLLLHCNISPFNRIRSQVWFKSDATFIALVSVFGLTNGYVNNTAMMNGPKMLRHPQSQGRAAITMLFCLLLGLAIGSGLARLIVSYVL